jgi:hypothetical protein
MEEARPFGLIAGTPTEPRIAYLKKGAVLTPELMSKVGGLEPTKVFRFVAKCEQSRCSHFSGERCSLGERVVEGLPPVVDAAPPCLIRPTCRWHAEQGTPACMRCPQVITMIPRAKDSLNAVALPEPPG